MLIIATIVKNIIVNSQDWKKNTEQQSKDCTIIRVNDEKNSHSKEEASITTCFFYRIGRKNRGTNTNLEGKHAKEKTTRKKNICNR